MQHRRADLPCSRIKSVRDSTRTPAARRAQRPALGVACVAARGVVLLGRAAVALREAADAFRRAETRNDGTLSARAYRSVLTRLAPEAALNTDLDGAVESTFSPASSQASTPAQSMRLAAVDLDGDRRVDFLELVRALAKRKQEQQERQKEAELRRQEPVKLQQTCATVGSIEKLSNEVAAMQAMEAINDALGSASPSVRALRRPIPRELCYAYRSARRIPEDWVGQRSLNEKVARVRPTRDHLKRAFTVRHVQLSRCYINP